MTKELFGTLENGEKVYQYTLDNKKGLKAIILSYGGIIKNLFVGGKDVVLGRDTLEEYLDNDGYYGAAIGRHANRIKKGEFEINGKKYNAAINDEDNSLHGGINGFDKKNWEVIESDTEETLTLKAFSPDGEEGFPGNLHVTMIYTLTEDNGIVIQYEAVSDKDTVVNLTNHSYFNLNGHDSGTIDEHTLWIDADFYTPNAIDCIPCGEILSVENTPFDFRTPKKIGEGFHSSSEQIKMFDGYDHNFVLNGKGFRKIASLIGDKTDIAMDVYTDKPGVQVYSGNCIDDERICKGGNIYAVHQAVCLETQFFPNSTSYNHFPSAILKKGEKYKFTTEYRFK